MSGKLYICPTPIGNLEDMTYRTVRILNEVDLIAAEDTRHSIKLLNHFEISKPLTSYYEHNRKEKGEKLAEEMSLYSVEVETFNKMVKATNLVVGHVLECVDHPDSDHLHVCQVDIGNKTLQIVCGAPNVRTGLKVIVAY